MKKNARQCYETVIQRCALSIDICFAVFVSILWTFCMCFDRTAIKAMFFYLNLCLKVMLNSLSCSFTGADPGGSHPARPPPQKNWKKYDFFGVKLWFFTRNTPIFSCLPPLGAIFLSAPPLTWNPGSAPDLHPYLFLLIKCVC